MDQPNKLYREATEENFNYTYFYDQNNVRIQVFGTNFLESSAYLFASGIVGLATFENNQSAPAVLQIDFEPINSNNQCSVRPFYCGVSAEWHFRAIGRQQAIAKPTFLREKLRLTLPEQCNI